jgi:hypothetical protein
MRKVRRGKVLRIPTCERRQPQATHSDTVDATRLQYKPSYTTNLRRKAAGGPQSPYHLTANWWLSLKSRRLSLNPVMPRGASFSFAYNGIKLDYQAIQTRRAVSRVRGNYHLFLKNQPKKPTFNLQDLGPKRKWEVPRMRNIE